MTGHAGVSERVSRGGSGSGAIIGKGAAFEMSYTIVNELRMIGCDDEEIEDRF